MVLRKPDIGIGVLIGLTGICKGLVRTWKHLAGSPSRTKAGGIMDGKIEELKKEKRTLKTSITKLLNELAAELSFENAKLGKCHGKTAGHRQATG